MERVVLAMELIDTEQRCCSKSWALVKTVFFHPTGSLTEEPRPGNEFSLFSKVNGPIWPTSSLRIFFPFARKSDWTRQTIWVDQSQFWAGVEETRQVATIKCRICRPASLALGHRSQGNKLPIELQVKSVKGSNVRTWASQPAATFDLFQGKYGALVDESEVSSVGVTTCACSIFHFLCFQKSFGSFGC